MDTTGIEITKSIFLRKSISSSMKFIDELIYHQRWWTNLIRRFIDEVIHRWNIIDINKLHLTGVFIDDEFINGRRRMSCRQLCPNTWNVFKDRAVRSELTNCLGAAFASKQKLLQLAMLTTHRSRMMNDSLTKNSSSMKTPVRWISLISMMN